MSSGRPLIERQEIETCPQTVSETSESIRFYPKTDAMVTDPGVQPSARHSHHWLWGDISKSNQRAVKTLLCKSFRDYKQGSLSPAERRGAEETDTSFTLQYTNCRRWEPKENSVRQQAGSEPGQPEQLNVSGFTSKRGGCSDPPQPPRASPHQPSLSFCSSNGTTLQKRARITTKWDIYWFGKKIFLILFRFVNIKSPVMTEFLMSFSFTSWMS